MKRRIVPAIIFGLFTATAGFGVLTDVIHRATEVRDGRWQYTYDANSISLPELIEQSTIWFDFDLYDDLAVDSTAPSDSEWVQMVWRLESVLADNEPYDPNGGAGKGPVKQGGFAVTSNLRDRGRVAAMLDETPETPEAPAFEPTDEMWPVIPEPATLFLLGLGALALRRKQKSTRI